MPLLRGPIITLMMLGTFASVGWRHIDTVFAIWCKYAVESGQVNSRLQDQGSQLGNDKSAGKPIAQQGSAEGWSKGFAT
ncbi:MAG: hypothetical protein B6D70_11665 [gamma proteobacterium symbiont of Stewartia floridana]|nr:MAG: hypothetical protein B6D76_02950 [gamma proteobacterium symbiont of Stewartia floridana]RLW59770.1 MAG: hypothetical protein B6D70_11665 [gamma proteobacterium symbiont of Stewartia floridana]RLW61843.1 MAG: hypothetical protein B6D75_01125 [gamma proteobacterium symbiont of Stewartia floridana]RLW64621.1 MAG: hypothetical protein B6D73_10280 [gamma proteobacterium symbiont of Stewartia floridana]